MPTKALLTFPFRLYAAILLFSMQGIPSLKAQFTIVPNPPGFNTGESAGYLEPSVVKHNVLYAAYRNNALSAFLTRFDGSALSVVPNPPGHTALSAPGGFGNAGYYDLMAIHRDTLFFRYMNDSGAFSLVRYDGQALSAFPFLPDYGVRGPRPFFYGYVAPAGILGNSMYMFGTDKRNRFTLLRYDNGMIVEIPNPPGFDQPLTGVLSTTFTPIVLNDTLYVRMAGTDGNYDLGKVHGSQLKVVHSPAGYELRDRGLYGDEAIVFGNALYLRYWSNTGSFQMARFDGNTLTLLNNPAGFNYTGRPIVMGNHLYLQYQGSNGNYALAKYDGNALSIIPSPPGYNGNNAGYYGWPVVAGNVLYMQYRNNSGNNTLAAYDGSNLQIIGNPAGYNGSARGYVTGRYTRLAAGKLYVVLLGNDDNYDLAEYDGASLRIINSPSGYDGPQKGFFGVQYVWKNRLYVQLRENNDNFDLAVFENDSLRIIPSPSGYEGSWAGCYGEMLAAGDTLYVLLESNNGPGLLAYLAENSSQLSLLPLKVAAPQVYPNPSTGKVRIHFPAQPNAMQSPASFQCFDMSGRQVAAFSLQFQAGEDPELDLGSLPAGLYAYTLRIGQSLYSGKLTKR